MHDAPFTLFPSPPHFLADQTHPFIMNGSKSAAASWRTTEADARLTFSGQNFPSPVESEEENFFAELNRRLTLSDSTKPCQVSKVVGGSPQSILGGIGSWSGRSSNQSPLQGPSPPTTPYEADYDAAGLIYAAAGQVEEQLKLKSEYPLRPSVNGAMSEQNHNLSAEYQKASFLAEQKYLAAARRAYNAALLYEHRLQILANSTRCTKPLTQSTRITLQQQHPRLCSKPSIQPAIPHRKESVGTGVFLPRRYNTSPAAPPRKREVTTNAIVPAKVLQALNMSLEEMNWPTQPHYSAYAASTNYKNFDELMVRRNVFLAQQQQRVARSNDINNLEVCLPKEWSY